MSFGARPREEPEALLALRILVNNEVLSSVGPVLPSLMVAANPGAGGVDILDLAQVERVGPGEVR